MGQYKDRIAGGIDQQTVGREQSADPYIAKPFETEVIFTEFSDGVDLQVSADKHTFGGVESGENIQIDPAREPCRDRRVAQQIPYRSLTGQLDSGSLDVEIVQSYSGRVGRIGIISEQGIDFEPVDSGRRTGVCEVSAVCRYFGFDVGKELSGSMETTHNAGLQG